MNPSSRRTRAASMSASPPAPVSTATRTRGMSVYSAVPFRLAAARRGAPTAASAAARPAIELGPEGGVFSNDFLIPLAFDRRLRNRSDRADRFGVLQVRIDRSDHDARLDGNQIDTDQRDADPCIDDDPLIEYSIKDVNQACSAGSSFNGHQTLLESFRACDALSAPPAPAGAASARPLVARARAPACATPRSGPTTPVCPGINGGRTSTSRVRSARPCRSNRSAAGCES